MDSKWIEGTLRDFDSAAGDCGDYDEVVPIIAQYAKLIAQVHEEDKWDALREQNAAWQDIVTENHETIVNLQAQVAVMRQALEAVSYSGDWYTNRKLIREAISAAPKVAWSGPVEVRLDAQGLPILVPLDAMQTLEQMDGQEHHVLVLMGEQGQRIEDGDLVNVITGEVIHTGGEI